MERRNSFEERAILETMDTLATLRKQAHLETRTQDWVRYADAWAQLDAILEARGYAVTQRGDNRHYVTKERET